MTRTLVLGCLLALALGVDFRIDAWDRDARAAPPAGADLLRSLLGNLSYEIRGLLSRLLYLKIDHYVHEGKPIDVGDGLLGVSMIGNTEIVPLYGLITFLDPHFFEAFSLGGAHLIYGLGKEKEGLALLETGVRYNPDDPLSSELLGQLGVYHGKDQGHPEKAIGLFERAYELRQHLPPERTPAGFVFSTEQLAGLAAVACFRSGERERARRWLERPHRLAIDHEIYKGLGVSPPPPPEPSVEEPPPGPGPARQPEAAREGMEHHHEEEAADPRYWLDPTRRARLSDQTRNAAALALLLCLPGMFRVLRRRA